MEGRRLEIAKFLPFWNLRGIRWEFFTKN